MSFIKQKEFAIILFVLPLLFLLLNYYTGIAEPAASELINWGSYLWNFSMIIGTYSLFRVHGTNIAKKGKDWSYSVVIFISFVTYFAASYVSPDVFKLILDYIQTPIMLTIWMGGFATLTMVFRGARTKSYLGVLLLLGSIFTVLRMAPIGPLIWPGFHTIGMWINDVPNMAVMRAITIVMGVGLIATLVREILGKETHYLGD